MKICMSSKLEVSHLPTVSVRLLFTRHPLKTESLELEDARIDFDQVPIETVATEKSSESEDMLHGLDFDLSSVNPQYFLGVAKIWQSFRI